MKALFLLLLVSVPVFAQKAQAVHAVRLDITAAADDELGRELARLVRDGLRERRNVVFISRDAAFDFSITLTAVELDEGVRCSGLVGGMLFCNPTGACKLSVYSGSDLRALAEHVGKYLGGKLSRTEKR